MTEKFCDVDTTTRLAHNEETDQQLSAVCTVDVRTKLKEKLLDRYAQRAPDIFWDYCAWENIPPGELTELDDEGDMIFSSEAFELDRSRAVVRLLISKGRWEDLNDLSTPPVTKESVLRLLDQIRAQIARQDDRVYEALTEAEVTKRAERYMRQLR